MDRLPRLHKARMIALAVPLVLLSGAYIFQYGYGMEPCEMCWWQRYGHFAALALAMAALFVRSSGVLVALAGTAIGVSGLIGAFHAGVEYHWWQGLTACTASAGSLDDLFNTPIVRCDVTPWSLFGISMAGWNFLFSSAAALAIGGLLLGQRKGQP